MKSGFCLLPSGTLDKEISENSNNNFSWIDEDNYLKELIRVLARLKRQEAISKTDEEVVTKAVSNKGKLLTLMNSDQLSESEKEKLNKYVRLSIQSGLFDTNLFMQLVTSESVDLEEIPLENNMVRGAIAEILYGSAYLPRDRFEIDEDGMYAFTGDGRIGFVSELGTILGVDCLWKIMSGLQLAFRIKLPPNYLMHFVANHIRFDLGSSRARRICIKIEYAENKFLWLRLIPETQCVISDGDLIQDIIRKRE